MKNYPKEGVTKHEDVEDKGIRAGIPGLTEYVVDAREPQGKSKIDVCYG